MRYIAFVVDDARLCAPLIDRARRDSGFECFYAAKRLVVLAERSAATLPIGERDGIIIGYLFKRTLPSTRVTSLEREGARIALSGGAELIRSYWGGYLAFLLPQDSDLVHILRDPSGQLSAYSRSIDGGTVIASDMATMGHTGLLAPSVDWSAVGQILRFPLLPMARTALIGVAELQPGVRVDLSRQQAQTCVLWDPWQFTASVTLGSSSIARDVGSIVEDCVATWADCFGGILLNLSGGLDSSILAAVLARQSMPVSAVNFVDDGPAGDESRYARSVAQFTGLKLEIRLLLADAVDIEASGSTASPRPLGRLIGQAFDAASAVVLADLKIGAVFDGVGGDNVFCFLQSPTPAADRLRQEGVGRALFATLDDVCRLTRCSFPTAIAWMLRKAWFSGTRYIWRGTTELLGAAVTNASAPADASPWLAAPRGAVPGKAAHVAMLLRSQLRVRDMAGIPRLSPLLSQPLMEYCLSIPSWRWCEGGIDRAPARQAFAARLPATTISRRGKGGMEALCLEVLLSNAEALSARLTRGKLATHGVIDPDAVARALCRDRLAGGTDFLRLLELAEAEAWVSYWDRPMTESLMGVAPVSR